MTTTATERTGGAVGDGGVTGAGCWQAAVANTIASASERRLIERNNGSMFV
jgi:hypothetical protein